MNTRVTDPNPITLVNVLTVEPENQARLVELLRDNGESVIRYLPGWLLTTLVASEDQRSVVIYSQWRDSASIEGMRADPRMRAYFPRIAALAALHAIQGNVAHSHHA